MNTRMVSIIAPCHNEEGVIAEFHRRLCAALDGIEEELEVVYIDDGSTDRTPFILNEICKRDPRVVVLRLSRCFGHQMALTAGLDHVEGDAVVIIDSDLQDPPETILPMLERWRNGAQVVYGQRLSRDGESRFKLVTAKAFYWLINAISDVHIPSNVGDFRLMDRTVIDALRAMPEQHRLLRAMISWLGYRQEGVPYHRERRYAGVTKYPLRKMIRLALDGLVSSSAMPLRIMSIVGLVTFVSSIVGAVSALTWWAWTGTWVPEPLSVFLIGLLFTGLQIFCFGIMGEYIGRIYGEVKSRPLYLIGERLGKGSAAANRPHARRGAGHAAGDVHSMAVVDHGR
ncbi:dolichol-phosphate mannosyltransferase [Azospirillum agricola]|uniref:glycosyltransferase family 2 protein n=1 Tax=Azospirillum agricola TaxID=1720247 RepID=UPI001AE80D0C|nr:glycosyltransferase family 2 protein [Azospirillum agricola]MBP2232987.1 dolichol-phosphate mannosyltransferase [Azospirillum agricola]